MSRQYRIRPWIIWALGAIGFFFAFFQRVAPSAMLGDLMRDFQGNAATIGTLSAFYFYAYISLQVPVGVMADRWGPRRLMTFAAFLCAAGGYLFATADTLIVAYAGRLLTGAGAAFFFVCGLKLVSVWFPPERFAFMSGMIMFIGVAGGIAGQAPVATAVDLVGWRSVVMATAVGGMVFGVLCWLIVIDHPDQLNNRNQPTDHRPTPPIWASLNLAIRQKQTWVMAILGAAMSSSLLAFGALWGVPYMMLIYGISRPEAAASVSLLLLGWALAAPTVGWISDKTRRRKAPLLICNFLALGCFSVLIYGPHLSLTVASVLIFLNGFFSAAMVLCFATTREHNSSQAAGSAVAFVNMWVVVSGAVLQPIIGWMLDLQWDGAIVSDLRQFSEAAYKDAFLTLIGAGIIAVIAAFLTRETYCCQVAS